VTKPKEWDRISGRLQLFLLLRCDEIIAHVVSDDVTGRCFFITKPSVTHHVIHLFIQMLLNCVNVYNTYSN